MHFYHVGMYLVKPTLSKEMHKQSEFWKRASKAWPPWLLDRSRKSSQSFFFFLQLMVSYRFLFQESHHNGRHCNSGWVMLMTPAEQSLSLQPSHYCDSSWAVIVTPAEPSLWLQQSHCWMKLWWLQLSNHCYSSWTIIVTPAESSLNETLVTPAESSSRFQRSYPYDSSWAFIAIPAEPSLWLEHRVFAKTLVTSREALPNFWLEITNFVK